MSSSTCPHQNLNVKHVATLFEEVQNHYANKLISIDEKRISSDERHRQKLTLYESYVKDLSVQTRLLLESLDELEKTANQRVALLESKLKKAHASLQQNSLADATKTVSNIESEKWKLNHENLDLKQDLDSLISFINTAKRTGRWDPKKLQLKTISVDRIIGFSAEEASIAVPLHKEIQYRDERIQVLQSEIEHLRKAQAELITKQASTKSSTFSALTGEEDLKSQNSILSGKVNDLRAKLAEECQKSETLKMDIRMKTNEIKELQQEIVENRKRSEEHIHDLSGKLKTVTDRHRETTILLNNDIKTKKQQIEQYAQQIEKYIHEKAEYDNERSELQRQVRVKDSINSDLELQIRNLQREITANNQSNVSNQLIESTVSRTDYERVEQELHLVRKRLDAAMVELRTKDVLSSKLEQDLRSMKKFHDDKFEEQIQTSSMDAEQLQSEIRALKRLCEEKEEQLRRQSSELRHCQEQLTVEQNKNASSEREEQQLRNTIQQSNDQVEKLQQELKQTTIQNEQLEQAIHDFNSQNHLLESKLYETMALIDLRNKTLIDYEQQMEKLKVELIQKHKELLDKQNHIDEIEQIVIEKTADVAQLTETLETGLVKSHQREKFAEDSAAKAMNEIKVLQREIRHLSDTLVERDRTNNVLNEQLHQLRADFKAKQDEFQQIQKSLNKQLAAKQDQLVRYDQSLHEIEIKAKYSKEECFIQEKEIVRLNNIQEEQENKIKTLQEELIKIQEEKDVMSVQKERLEGDLRTIKIYREDETRKYGHELEKLNSDLTSLRMNEELLLKNIDELKENLAAIVNDRDELREQNENYHVELENIQRMLYEETESGSKASSKVVLLTRQLDEEQKRSTEASHQLDDARMQLKSVMMTNDTLKTELIQTRSLLQDHIAKETELKQTTSRTSGLLEEQSKTLEDRQRELETINQLLSRLQIDYERSKNDLSDAQDQLVQFEIINQTLKQHLNEKSNEASMLASRLHQTQQDFHAYEKEHRYSNEEQFEREQRMKAIEIELATAVGNFEKLQREHNAMNEELTRCRCDLEQSEKSDLSHKERLIQSIDESKIYKRKLALLGDCFKTVVRKASETSERWANVTSRLHEQITDLSEETNKLQFLDDRFEQSTKLLTFLRSQHEDLLLQFATIKPVLEKAFLISREYKRKWSQVCDENRHLRTENKRLRGKIDDFHRAENIFHNKIEEQETSLNLLRKELNQESQNHSETQTTLERLKHSFDDTVHERDQLLKNISNANKKIEKLEHEADRYVDENRLLQQAVQKLEKQLNNALSNSEAFQRSSQQSELSYQDKINECESLLRSLKDANKDSLSLLEQKKAELNITQAELQALKYEQSGTISKLEKLEEINQDLKRHISILEKSIDEHKRVIRKREKELEQIKNEFEKSLASAAAINHQNVKHEAEINVLRLENTSLNEELRMMRENVTRCQEEQRRLKKDCDQALSLIQDGIPELCLDEDLMGHKNGTLQEHLKKIPCLMQQLTGDRENLKTKNALLLQFVRGLTTDLNDCQSSQKKYRLLKAHSKQQQLLLNQLETHVRFYESVFKEKGFFPAIEYLSASSSASAPDVIDSNLMNNYRKSAP